MIKTFSSNFKTAIEQIKPHDRLALLYETPEERRATVFSFLRASCLQGNFCAIITTHDRYETLREELLQDNILNSSRLDSGQLTWVDSAGIRLNQDTQAGDTLKSALDALMSEAESKGFTRIRILDEMKWFDQEKMGFADLLVYEQQTNQFYLHAPASGLCLFDWGGFDPECLLKIIKTHRFIIYHEEIFTNPFYIPPESYDEESQAERDLQSLLSGLKDLKSWENELVSTIRNLRYLVEISKVISGTTDMSKVINEVLNNILDHLGAKGAAVLIYDPDTHDLRYEAGRGFVEAYDLDDVRISLDAPFVPWQKGSKKSVFLAHPQSDPGSPEHLKRFLDETFSNYFAVLLTAQDGVKGMLEIFFGEDQASSESWQPYIDALVAQLSNAIEHAQAFGDLQQKVFELTMAYDVTIARFAEAMDRGDNRISRNTQRVSEMTVRLAREMGATEEEIIHIRRGVLLQDISKLSLPEKILQKPGPLTDKEWKIMHQHPQVVFDLLEDIKVLRPALEIPYCHNENWDGSGYPRGLVGDEIPLAARQFAVVNVYDALLTDRPYRPSWEEVDALAYIRSHAGGKFDPVVVDAFFRMLDEQAR